MLVMRKKLTEVARVSKMTRAAAALIDARWHLLRGAPCRARARLWKALAIAERHELRYEAACAHFELAHLPHGGEHNRARHRSVAANLFNQMGVPIPAPRRS
jgi:hypothetical protein